MSTIEVATCPRVDAIRKMWSHVPWNGPIPPDETREAVAYNANREVIGRFAVRADYCLVLDTLRWEGWFWSLQMLAECGQTLYPGARWFSFDDPRPLSGIRKA
jgi:hypothetical protein